MRPLAADCSQSGPAAILAQGNMSAASISRLAGLAVRISAAPVCGDADRADARLADLHAAAGAPAILAGEPVQRLLRGVFAGSPYLTELILAEPPRLLRCLSSAPDDHLDTLLVRIADEAARAGDMPEAMTVLRQIKTEAALLIALADLAGIWPVMRVTQALSLIADAAIMAGLRFLLTQAAAKGQYTPADLVQPEIGSGYIVLGMGKHGAFELNYSSDVDLIVFYEAGLANLADGIEPQAFFIRMTRDLVRLLQEHTGDGYVFRIDLRLRPDPGATPVALSTGSALNYYESFGQNWERAAMIKARAIAGDIEAGNRLLTQLKPYVWRKYLDYAAIADIHAMKRQIHAVKGFGDIAVAGHNIKLGRGGIREIEFFAQTQQLIAGGRQSDLRTPSTLEALTTLTRHNWIDEAVRTDMESAYLFLRTIEHRLQMTADEQTQRLPSDPDALERLARFSGFAGTPEFAAVLRGHLERVQAHYAALFEDDPTLTRGVGNLVFAGEQDDPQTVETLTALGFSSPASVIATVRGWHHGRYPAVRSPRAREMLTVVQPLLVEALSRTTDPDRAFAVFDQFLSELPSGVQLFSLLRNNANLLGLLADIMGTAPRLARILARRRRLLDAVLDPRFFGLLPTSDDLRSLLDNELQAAGDYQERLDRARVVGGEQAFLVGVRLLTGTISATQAGHAYAQLADHMLIALEEQVQTELALHHGHVPAGAAAILAMGKLGGDEMTAASDLDLIVIYDFPEDQQSSNGSRPLAGTQYFGRLTQRLIAALSAPTAEGALYDVDMRLRPSGQKGPVATRLTSFIEYQESEAWTWEHMALTRARVVTGPAVLRGAIEEAIRQVLTRPRDRSRIAKDVRDMRALIAKEKGTTDIWDLKQVRGGLVDLEFIAQFLQLVHAHQHPEILDTNTAKVLVKLKNAGVLPPHHAEILLPAIELIQDITQLLRLCFEGPFEPAKAPDGLKQLLARAGQVPDFERLETQLEEMLAAVAEAFEQIIS
jgi:[glutamine synthetase] adenylyltransferase / [glutamine synthetase]-adenylyl-L-tyrosine phosphorylase